MDGTDLITAQGLMSSVCWDGSWSPSPPSASYMQRNKKRRYYYEMIKHIFVIKIFWEMPFFILAIYRRYTRGQVFIWILLSSGTWSVQSEVHRRFEATCCLNLQGRRAGKANTKHSGPESSTFLRNIGQFLPDHTESHSIPTAVNNIRSNREILYRYSSYHYFLYIK
jgi:hypothetical protein